MTDSATPTAQTVSSVTVLTNGDHLNTETLNTRPFPLIGSLPYMLFKLLIKTTLTILVSTLDNETKYCVLPALLAFTGKKLYYF